MQTGGYMQFWWVSRMLHVALLCSLMLGASSAYSASKTILVLGDSLSAEYGLVRGSGWVALLEQRLQTDKVDAAVVNASISGETTSGGATRLPALLKKHRPSIVIIELGANDGLRGLPFAATKDNLQVMIKAANNAKAQVLLIGMRLPPNYGTDYTEKFFSLFATVARQTKVSLVPFFLEGVATMPEMFQSDRIHPTSAAQPAMLENVWPKLKPMLSK